MLDGVDALNLDALLGRFDEHWQPKTIADLNDYEVKLVKVQGEFVWHDHPDTDELFLVLRGALTIQLRDGEVPLRTGELFVVPKGVQHRPVAAEEASILLLEPRGVANTGDAGGALTARPDRLT